MICVKHLTLYKQLEIMEKTELVSELNEDIFNIMGSKFLDKNIFSWTFTTDGYSEGIYFNEELVWTSEAEDREWNYASNDYTPDLKTYLLNRLKEVSQNKINYINRYFNPDAEY